MDQLKAYIYGMFLAVLLALTALSYYQHSQIQTMTTDNATLTSQVASKSMEIKTCSDSVIALGVAQDLASVKAKADLAQAKKSALSNYNTGADISIFKPVSKDDFTASKEVMYKYIDLRGAQ